MPVEEAIKWWKKNQGTIELDIVDGDFVLSFRKGEFYCGIIVAEDFLKGLIHPAILAIKEEIRNAATKTS